MSALAGFPSCSSLIAQGCLNGPLRYNVFESLKRWCLIVLLLSFLVCGGLGMGRKPWGRWFDCFKLGYLSWLRGGKRIGSCLTVHLSSRLPSVEVKTGILLTLWVLKRAGFFLEVKMHYSIAYVHASCLMEKITWEYISRKLFMSIKHIKVVMAYVHRGKTLIKFFAHVYIYVCVCAKDSTLILSLRNDQFFKVGLL